MAGAGCTAYGGRVNDTGGYATLAAAKYAELTTFRRTGVGVPTPVWIAPLHREDGERALAVITVDQVGKTKRLAHTQRVELRECDVRGRVQEGAPTWTGQARVVRDPGQVGEVRAAIAAKYGLPARAFGLVEWVGRVAPRLVTPKPRAGILITLDD